MVCRIVFVGMKASELFSKIDVNKNGQLSLIEYLIFRFKKTVADVEAVEPGAEEAVVSEIATKLQVGPPNRTPHISFFVKEALPSIQAEAAVNVTTVSAEIANKAHLDAIAGVQKQDEDEGIGTPH